MALELNGSTGVSLVQTLGMPPGAVVQVIQAENSTESVTTSTSFVDTPLFAVITPKSISNKILVSINASFFIESSTLSNFELHSLITRNNSPIKQFSRNIIIRAAAYSGILGNGSHNSLLYLDSPATTASTTYRLQLAVSDSNANGRINKDNIGRSTITLLEIAA